MRRDNLTRDEAATRARLVSDASYEITLDLSSPTDDAYRCETVLRFRCADPGAATFLDHQVPTVDSVELNGVRLDPKSFDGIRVQLDGLAAENEVRIVSHPAYSHSGVGLHRFLDPVDDRLYTYTDFEPFDANKVYPCFDQPDVKARFRFTVLAPDDWEVASNLVADAEPVQEAPGVRRWTFTETPPMSTYITCVIAGPYHVVRDRHGDLVLGLWCRQSMAKHLDPPEILEITKQGFDFFERAFGVPYPWGKYDQAFVPEFNSGAMENIGLVTFNESYVFRSKVTEAARERRAETILHEMAHMWFGDLVTMRWWDDLWLNETFASYMAVLSQVAATRFSNGWVTFANSEKTWAYQQDQLPTTHPIVADAPDIESVYTNFDGITYAKGASVLRQLVAWVGEDAFLEGLRGYFERHAYGNTELHDFLAALEATSGRDLHAWSKEWLETAGVNTLRAVPQVDDGTLRGLTVAQEAPEEWPILRPHRVTVGLYDRANGSLELRRREELDLIGVGVEVPGVAGEPVPDLIVVNDADLAYAKVRLDDRSLATAVAHLRELSDPLARAVTWGSCWDMVRDAEMPAREYLRLVLANAETEDDVGVLQRLLAQAVSSIEHFGDPANRDAASTALAAGAERAMRAAAPGSDHQLAWTRAFAGAAAGPEQLGFVRGLLEGTESLEGLVVDTDLRWHLLTCLASSGAAEEAMILAELERDPTDQGRRHGATARGAMPTEEAKAEAWRAVTEDTSLATATIGALIRGFQQPHQRHLLEPYAERYFDRLVSFWDERDLEAAMAFTRGMYPATVVDGSTVDLTDRALEERSLAVPARRILLEGRDQITRAIRARARDAAATG